MYLNSFILLINCKKKFLEFAILFTIILYISFELFTSTDSNYFLSGLILGYIRTPMRQR